MTETEYTFNGIRIDKRQLTGKINARVGTIDQYGNIMLIFD